MRSHLDVLRDLDPAVRADLQGRSTAAGLRHLALYLAALGASGAWITSGAAFWPVALLVLGILLVFLFTLQHECSHDTPFDSKALCDWTGRIIGVLLLNPHMWFRYFHLAHHRHTNDPAHDPELQSGGLPQTWRAYVWHVTGLPLWASAIRLIVRNAFGDPSAPYLPKRVVGTVRTEARVALVLYALAALSLLISDAVIWLWVMPALMGQPFLRLYLLAEHGRCPAVANMLENTRTTYTNRIVRFVAWNMPYHIEHHSAPNVPFHHLPQLHALMRQDLVSTSSSYRAFTNDYVSELM